MDGVVPGLDENGMDGGGFRMTAGGSRLDWMGAKMTNECSII